MMQLARWTRLLHRTSAAILAAFLLIHLVNHVAGVWGVAAHIAFMDAARVIYRTRVAEGVLLAAVLVQIVTGIALLRAGWGKRRDFWARTQVISGAYLAFFLANHTFWVLFARIGYDLDSNFHLAATFLTIPPFPLLFAPYYVLGVFAAFAHIACAVHVLARSPAGDHIARAAIGTGTVVAPLTVAVFMGAFDDIQLPPAYRALVAPLL